MRTRFRIGTVFLIALVVLTALPAEAKAQPIEVRPPMPIVSLEGVTVDSYEVHAAIDGPIAEVTVTQVFRNESVHVAEGTFLFPLPHDAAVGDLQLTVDGTVLEGRIMDSEAARHVYEETVRQVRDPALLEYAGRGLFRTSVFPIPPRQTRTLMLRYAVLLKTENGLHRFTVPLGVPGAVLPPQQTSMVVDLADDEGIRSVYSPSHDVQVDRLSDEQATVSFEATAPTTTEDFALFFGTSSDSVGLNLVSYQAAGEDGHFVLLVTPSVEAESDDVAPRNVIFVLDVSGSMEGPKLAQAKDAVAYVVDHLNPDDRFNLIAFSTGVELWRTQVVSVNPESARDAKRWIDGLDAAGSTDVNRALLEALAQTDGMDAGERSSYVLFMTDGLPTHGETSLAKIIDNAQDNLPGSASVRLFPFGVGFDVNTDLLDTVSQALGGRSQYVRPDEKIDEAVSDFYATIQTPVLTDVDVAFAEEVHVSDTYPYPLPDLFAGEQLVVAGRYRVGGATNVELSGRVGADLVSFVYPEMTLARAGGDPFVARLWATRKIGTMMEQIRRNGPEAELVDAIVELSLRYGIVTPYTSYLVEEPESSHAAGRGHVAEPRALSANAFSSVQEQAAEAAEAPASGEFAVESSVARQKLRTATAVTTHRQVRYAGGRTFIRQERKELPDGTESDFWVDTAYREDMSIETVGFASERYFELAREPNLAAAFAVSAELLVTLDDERAVRVTTMREAIGSTDELLSDDAAAAATMQNVWGELRQWLMRR